MSAHLLPAEDRLDISLPVAFHFGSIDGVLPREPKWIPEGYQCNSYRIGSPRGVVINIYEVK